MNKYWILGTILYKEYVLTSKNDIKSSILWIEVKKIRNIDHTEKLSQSHSWKNGLMGPAYIVKVKIHHKNNNEEKTNIGSSVSCMVLMMPQDVLFPGAYDFTRHMRICGVMGYGTCISGIKISPRKKTNFLYKINEKRYKFMHYLKDNLIIEQSGVAGALLIGDKSLLPQNIRYYFQDSGLAHVLAVSGLHVVLIFIFLRKLSHALLIFTLPRQAQYYNFYNLPSILAWLGISFYFLLSGGAIPSQRAWIMTTISSIMLLCNRPYYSLRALIISAVIILLLRPESLFHPSFQLSFAASLQLICMPKMPYGLKKIGHRYKIESFMQTLWSGFMIGISMIPLTIYHFQRFNGQSMWANIVAIPLMSFVIMPMGLCVFLLWMILGWTPSFLLFLWSCSLKCLVWIAAFCAQIPGASVPMCFIHPSTMIFWIIGWWSSLYHQTILNTKSKLSLMGFFSLLLSLYGILNPQRPQILVEKNQS